MPPGDQSTQGRPARSGPEGGLNLVPEDKVAQSGVKLAIGHLAYGHVLEEVDARVLDSIGIRDSFISGRVGGT